MSFANLAAKVNLATNNLLGDVTATINGESVKGIFTKNFNGAIGLPSGPFSGFGGLVDDVMPLFECDSSLITSIAVENTVTINSINYIVARIDDDESGWLMIYLKKL